MRKEGQWKAEVTIPEKRVVVRGVISGICANMSESGGEVTDATQRGLLQDVRKYQRPPGIKNMDMRPWFMRAEVCIHLFCAKSPPSFIANVLQYMVPV